MADPNISSSLPASPPPFSPPNYAVWVNALWFLSLVISLTCALLATLLQQWARRYLKVTQPRYSPHKRARIRAFFAEGVDKFLLPWAVEALPTLLHLSLFLFFAGLAVFLWNVNRTIFKLVLSWVGICTALYGCITVVPLFRHDSPYHTPLSLPIWHIVTGISTIKYRFFRWFSSYLRFGYTTYNRLRDLEGSYRKMLIQGMQKTAEETALNLTPEIDTRAFLWTFDSLDEDHELERFFAGLPGFRNSKLVKDPLPDLTAEQQAKLSHTLIGLLNRNITSDLLPELVKSRRTAICVKAIGQASILRASQLFLDGIVSEDRYGPVQSAEIARLLRGWGNGNDAKTNMVIQATVSSIVAKAQRRDDFWYTMASDEMGVSESVLRNHSAHGESLSLAVLIHIVRQQFTLFWDHDWPWPEISKVLEASSKFNMLDTSLELQHEFCALWNQIVSNVQVSNGGLLAFHTLRRIRNVYLALHQHTDSSPTRFSASTDDRDRILQEPSSYPLCIIPSHHPDSTPHLHDVSTSIAIPHVILHDDTAPVPISAARTPVALSSSIPALHVDENFVDVPLLDDNIPSSFNPTRQAAMESPCIPATSSDPSTAVGAIRDMTSAREMPPTVPATLTFASSVSSTGAVALQNTTDPLVHSGAPAIPPSASSGPVLDNITDQSLSLTLS
ncbi:hypothetical protein EI94DRAFT_778229 [Lactarius quietus]|nr:hypothetical protein EI94DRAFT_778229 [Lactarius quietus]